MSTMNLDDPIQRSAAVLRERAGPAPRFAVLLGSGWNVMTQYVLAHARLPYADLPAFPKLGVGGHAGELIRGRVEHQGRHCEVALLCGRKHAYETGAVDGMKGLVRTLAAWGCEVLVQTNAAGSLDLAMRPGELMLIRDHLNLVQRSPLFDEPGNARFVDMANAYDAPLRHTARAAAAAAGHVVHEGVYAWMMGPQFETPAEIRMLQGLGAQAVGMSTVPETILARHAGLKVLALSLMTNMGCGLEAEHLSHAHTLATAEAAGQRAAEALAAIVTAL